MDAPLPSNLVSEWERFIRDGRSAREIWDDGLLFPLQRIRENVAMRNEVPDACVVLEVGADKGGSAFLWASMPYVKRACFIEIRGVPYVDLFRRRFPAIDFLAIEASSYDPETVDRVSEWLGGDRFDVAFLDGDKLRYMDDFLAYQQLTREGGRVLLHDVHVGCEPVREAFAAIGKEWPTRTIIDTTEGRQALERKALGYQPRTSHEGWLYHWGETSAGVGVVEV